MLACKPSSSAEAQEQSLVSNQTTTRQEEKTTQQETIGPIAGTGGSVYNGSVDFAGSDKRSVIIISLLLTTFLLFI